MNPKYTILTTLFLLHQACNPSASTEKDSKNTASAESSPKKPKDSKAKKNPLLTGLERAMDSESGIHKRVEVGQKYISDEVDKIYQGMNSALERKDLPGFMKAYRDAHIFDDHLAGIGPTFSKHYWSELFHDLKIRYFGNIATKVLSNPAILENWPRNCESLDSEARGLVQDLYAFNRNRRRVKGIPTIKKSSTGDFIFHDDKGLSLVRAKRIHAEAVGKAEARYFVDGTYSEMRFSPAAKLMLYTLLTTMHKPDNSLDSTVERCSFIDLGMDGIDRCDARLNGIPSNDTAIKMANQRARNCMTVTTKKLRQRYAGTGYFKR